LILPAYLAEKLRLGTHRGEDITGQTWSSDQFKQIKQNNNGRFHFIKASTDYQVPELIVDFKHIYSINRNLLYKEVQKSYLATLGELFREDLSHRYSHFLSRVGLPEIN
jgi:hypothetical protein